ncbi:hypothetical protein TWF696_003167 [Orbilia brochopaga]|uniref:DUF1295 domain-containing protein n=1 Tax=Orbilia brochopaga TaxID=3140254 RepID=A0AAV9TZW7_9PEZI
MASLPLYQNINEVSQSPPNIFQLFQTAVGGLQQVLNGKSEFSAFYKDTDPFGVAILGSLLLSALALGLSEVTQNFSQVDRWWSLAPAIYVLHYSYWARLNDLSSDRIDTVAVVVAIWSIRLTYNYWRKGGYQWSSEDYRWEVIRGSIGRPAFILLNISFISFIQNFILLAITSPVYVFLILAKNFPQHNSENVATVDKVFSRGMMLAVILEFFADQQQWNFHQAKSHYKSSGRAPPGWDKSELDRGFLYSGLWAFSRHPNFTGEQLFWVLLYQWSAFVTDSVYNWTGIGALSYLLLFQVHLTIITGMKS